MKIIINNFVIPTDAITHVTYQEGFAFQIHLIGNGVICICKENDTLSKPKDYPEWPARKDYSSTCLYENACKMYTDHYLVRKYRDDERELYKKTCSDLNKLYDTFMKYWKPEERFLDINKLASEQTLST